MLMLGLLGAVGGSTAAEEDGGEETTDPAATGDSFSHTVGGVSFNMVHVEGKSFFTGVNDAGDIDDDGTDEVSGTATVSSAYRIAETEVTYELWNAVHTWATSNGYTFANAGTEGNDGTAGADPTSASQEPVTYINWRDAMVWTNALTEYYNAQNGTSLTPVYYSDSEYTTPIRDSSDGAYGSSVNSNAGSFDKPYIYAATTGNTDMANNTADGFRLPTMHEWELAARYIDDANGDGDIQDSGEYYPGDFASGATADYNDATATGNVAVYSGNSGSSTAAVKSKSPNALGLYDMSGNVFEWNFDWHSDNVGSHRVGRGGSYYATAPVTQVGYVLGFSPYYEIALFGFRPSRTP